MPYTQLDCGYDKAETISERMYGFFLKEMYIWFIKSHNNSWRSKCHLEESIILFSTKRSESEDGFVLLIKSGRLILKLGVFLWSLVCSAVQLRFVYIVGAYMANGAIKFCMFKVTSTTQEPVSVLGSDDRLLCIIWGGA